MSEQIRDLAHRWLEEVWNQKRSDIIDLLVHPACVGHHEGQTTCGGAEIRAMRDQLLTLMPDVTVTIEEIVADETNAVVRWKFTGTSSAGSRQPLSFDGLTWLKFSGGRIIEGWDRWNQGAFLQQLAV